MALDSRGIVSVVEIIVYIPLLLLSIKLLVKYGFKREGWLYLLLLSIIRVAGGITQIMSEQQSNPSTTLLIVVTIFETSGVSPLLVATLGFLGTVKQSAFQDGHLIHKALRIMNILSHVALGLTIYGGVTIGDNQSPDNVDKINQGNKYRHIGVILFAVQLALTVLVTFYMWTNIHNIMKHRRTLLKAITGSLPFLGIRVLYTVLSAFSPLGIPGVTEGSPSLAKFNSTHGTFGIYLFMSVIMEFVVIVIYVTAGLVIPLNDDYPVGQTTSPEAATNLPLYAHSYPPVPGHSGFASSMSVPQKPEDMPSVYYPPQYA